MEEEIIATVTVEVTLHHGAIRISLSVHIQYKETFWTSDDARREAGDGAGVPPCIDLNFTLSSHDEDLEVTASNIRIITMAFALTTTGDDEKLCLFQLCVHRLWIMYFWSVEINNRNVYCGLWRPSRDGP